MPGKSITLDLPDDLYEQVQQVAAQSQRPMERVVLESLRLLFAPPPSSVDLATDLATLAGYTDDQLWAVVYQRLAWPQSQRLHDLSAKSKLGGGNRKGAARIGRPDQLERPCHAA